MQFKEKYDLIVVGAGPGGSVAAKEAAEKGLSVLLLERDREIGLPIRCAEAVGYKGLAEFFSDDHWVMKNHRRKYKLRFVAPDGTPLDLDHDSEAAVLDRKNFDYELGRQAALAGAQVLTQANVTGLLKTESIVQGIVLEYQNKTYQIQSSMVIGADGTETRVGRWAGIPTAPKLKDLEACVQYTMTDIDIDPERMDFYFGIDVAPNGYAWVFPKGDRTANVGLGVDGEHSKDKKAIDYLNDFVAKNFPNGSIINVTCGGVICGQTLQDISGAGIMLVGDAAHHTNAISGGGIVNAMKAGRIAAAVAVEAVKKNDFSAAFLKKYDQLWHKKQGSMNQIFYKLKESIENIDDQLLNKITHKLNKLPLKKHTIFNIFKDVLVNKPSLLLEIPKLFMTSKDE